MASLDRFEEIVRRTPAPTRATLETDNLHPFDARNIHPGLPPKVRALFDDGHFAESTFAAFKFVESRVKTLSGAKGVGFALMFAAFDEAKPLVKLNGLLSDNDVDEQRGFRHLFAGAQAAIRNPRGHGNDPPDGPDLCLDHLSVASVLLRTLDAAGFAQQP